MSTINLSMTAVRSRVSAVLFAIGVQYFITQAFVSIRFRGGYSWANNTISDLGNTACGRYGSHIVCSPNHNLMNLSFLVLGIGTAGGSYFALRATQNNRRIVSVAWGLMVAAGIGTFIVGLFPENTVSSLHIVGAGLPFILGNLSLIGLSFMPELNKGLRIVGLMFGLISLSSFILFVTQHYLRLGGGTVERVTAYPQTVWLAVYGFEILMNPKKKNIMIVGR